MYQSKASKYIARYRELYGNKYTYNPELIINSYTKFPVECDCGNVFTTTASDHLRYGCPVCGRAASNKKRSYSQEEYLTKLKEVHGDKFDTSRLNYVKNNIKITLGCKADPTHGFFEISPVEALRGHGCQKCGGTYKMSNDEYIAKLKEVHGDRYDLSLVDFKGSRYPVKAICKDHGEFEMRADHFMKGGNCPRCSRIITGQKTKSDKEEFQERVKKLYGDAYDTSESIYLGSGLPITVRCLEHGYFDTIPARLLSGTGCYKCGREKSRLALFTTKEEKFEKFVKKGRRVHGDKYTYYLEDHVDSQTKTRIKCNNCNRFFQQAPSRHCRGDGCPYCNESTGEKRLAKIFDKLEVSYQREYKIANTNTRYEYDFFLPEHGILIEFHGRQHFEPVEIFGGQKALEDTQRRDKAKVELAKAHKIPLVEFTHKDMLLEEEAFEALVISRVKEALQLKFFP